MRVALRCTMVMSAIPLGEVVSVPRSRTERTPRIVSRIVCLGMSFGGGAAARENGSAALIISENERLSMVVTMVESVPPLAPELLSNGQISIFSRCERIKCAMAYVISLMEEVISLVSQDSSSRTRFTRLQARISAGALSSPTDGMICDASQKS